MTNQKKGVTNQKKSFPGLSPLHALIGAGFPGLSPPIFWQGHPF